MARKGEGIGKWLDKHNWANTSKPGKYSRATKVKKREGVERKERMSRGYAKWGLEGGRGVNLFRACEWMTHLTFRVSKGSRVSTTALVEQGEGET